MMPDGTLSPTPVPGEYLDPVARRTLPLEDWERGGRGIGNASEGLMVQLWHLVVDPDTGSFNLTAEDGTTHTSFARTDVAQASLAFDQLMQPVYAWIEPAGAFLRYFDGSIGGFAIMEIPNATFVRLTLDDKRPAYLGSSDVTLAYKYGTNLCVRFQREAYAIEHLLAENVVGQFIAVGMNDKYRLQFRVATLA